AGAAGRGNPRTRGGVENVVDGGERARLAEIQVKPNARFAQQRATKLDPGPAGLAIGQKPAGHLREGQLRVDLDDAAPLLADPPAHLENIGTRPPEIPVATATPAHPYHLGVVRVGVLGAHASMVCGPERICWKQ